MRAKLWSNKMPEPELYSLNVKMFKKTWQAKAFDQTTMVMGPERDVMKKEVHVPWQSSEQGMEGLLLLKSYFCRHALSKATHDTYSSFQWEKKIQNGPLQLAWEICPNSCFEKMLLGGSQKLCWWVLWLHYIQYAFVSLNVNNVMPRTRECFLVLSALLPCPHVLHIPRLTFDFLVHPALWLNFSSSFRPTKAPVLKSHFVW